MEKSYSKTQKLTLSALIAAMYISIMYITAPVSFGAHQIRFATAIYALNFLHPFLLVPLAMANAMSNWLLGGLGFFDIFGGFAVGLVTGGALVCLRYLKLPAWTVIFPVILGPAFVVPLWLSHILSLPYWTLVLNLAIGQTVPGILGYVLIQTIKRRKVGKTHE